MLSPQSFPSPNLPPPPVQGFIRFYCGPDARVIDATVFDSTTADIFALIGANKASRQLRPEPVRMACATA